jgi:hypothetical protein
VSDADGGKGHWVFAYGYVAPLHTAGVGAITKFIRHVAMATGDPVPPINEGHAEECVGAGRVHWPGHVHYSKFRLTHCNM